MSDNDQMSEWKLGHKSITGMKGTTNKIRTHNYFMRIRNAASRRIKT